MPDAPKREPDATGHRHLDLALLRSFVAVVQSQRFSAAGERIGRSQSAVSLRIQRLERQLGRRLLYRTARGAFLTTDGQRLFEHALTLLRLNDEVTSMFGVTGRTLSVGVPGLLAQGRTAELLVALQRPLDGAALQLRVADSRSLRHAFDDGLVDVIVAAWPAGAELPPQAPVRELPTAWAGAAGVDSTHWPGGVPPLVLLDGEIVLPDTGAAPVALRTADAPSYLSALRCGLGVGCVPAALADPRLRTDARWPGLPPAPHLRYAAAWRRTALPALLMEDVARRLLALLVPEPVQRGVHAP